MAATILSVMAAHDPPHRRNGHPIDWSGVLAAHGRWLRTVVFARSRDADAVDEIMQDVSLAALEQKAPIDDVARLPQWLYRLAVRQAALYWRRQTRERRRLQRLASRCPHRPSAAAHGDPLDWLLANERGQLVQSGLARLSRRDCEILLLKYTENWTYRQLAEHLGLSPAAVESRLHRARQNLRDVLGREQFTQEEAS